MCTIANTSADCYCFTVCYMHCAPQNNELWIISTIGFSMAHRQSFPAHDSRSRAKPSYFASASNLGKGVCTKGDNDCDIIKGLELSSPESCKARQCTCGVKGAKQAGSDPEGEERRRTGKTYCKLLEALEPHPQRRERTVRILPVGGLPLVDAPQHMGGGKWMGEWDDRRGVVA